MTCGIYMWKNRINGHSYIGLSKDIERRWREHSRLPFTSTRADDTNKAFYRAIKKYGVDNFEKIVLEECNESDLPDREKYYIKKYQTFIDKAHYNLTAGGDVPSPNARLTGEKHGMSKLTEKEVIFCRKAYSQGERSRAVYEKYFNQKIKYSGFLRMWHGKTWKHVMPEVFKHNPHKKAYNKSDRNKVIELYRQSGLTPSGFTQSKKCPVGVGTFYNMLKNPEFYK